jgi:hypothetical protein
MGPVKIRNCTEFEACRDKLKAGIYMLFHYSCFLILDISCLFSFASALNIIDADAHFKV